MMQRKWKLMDDLPPNLGENLKEIHLRYKDAPFPRRGEKLCFLSNEAFYPKALAKKPRYSSF